MSNHQALLGEAIPRNHQVPFLDHKDGEGMLNHPRSILRMRVEKGEVCWSDVDFESEVLNKLYSR